MTAALTELEPTGNHRKAALASTVASVGGLGFGPVLAGLLAQYAPAPHVLPFVVEIVLLLPAAATIASRKARSIASSSDHWASSRPKSAPIFAISAAAISS